MAAILDLTKLRNTPRNDDMPHDGGHAESHFQTNTSTAANAGGSPPNKLKLPTLQIDVTNPAIIGPEAQAVRQKKKTKEEAISAVEKYHDAEAKASIIDQTNEVIGLEQNIATRMYIVEDRLKDQKTILSKLEKWLDKQVPIPAIRTPQEKLKIVVFSISCILLVAWSIGTLHNYIYNKGIAGYRMAYLMAVGPLMVSVAAKMVFEKIPPKMLNTAIYITVGLGIVSGLGYVICMGLEGVQNVNTTARSMFDSGNTAKTNAVATEWRAASQLGVEIFIGSLLFYGLSEALNCGTGKTKTVQEVNPTWQQEEDLRAMIESEITNLKNQKAEIEEWLKTRTELIDAAIQKATSFLTACLIS